MTVIQFPPPANDDTAPHQAPRHEPFLRLPPVTLALLAALVGIHLLLWAGARWFDPRLMLAAVMQLAFIPASLTDTINGALPFSIIPFTSLLTAGFIHGSWLHLGVNVTMLLAAGGGVERHIGKFWMVLLFLSGVMVGNLTYYVLSPQGMEPLVGASGGISALFGACMLLLGGGSRKQVISWLAIFIGISLVQSLMGAPDGSAIAGSAHIGGFVFGLGLTAWLRTRYLPQP